MWNQRVCSLQAVQQSAVLKKGARPMTDPTKPRSTPRRLAAIGRALVIGVALLSACGGTAATHSSSQAPSQATSGLANFMIASYVEAHPTMFPAITAQRMTNDQISSLAVAVCNSFGYAQTVYSPLPLGALDGAFLNETDQNPALLGWQESSSFIADSAVSDCPQYEAEAQAAAQRII